MNIACAFYFMLFFATVGYCQSIRGPGGNSRLSFGQTAYDFGQVPRNTPLRHAFKYGVSSADTLIILRTVSSCGCTFAKVPKQTLPPGDTGAIEVTYATGLIEGPFEKTFSISTNSKTTPEIQLVLKGSVVRDAWTDPPIINLDEAQIGSAWKTDLRIHWSRWRKPRFKIVPPIPEAVAVGNIRPEKGDSTLWHLDIGLSPQAGPRYSQDTLVLKTADTSWPEIKVPVQGTPADMVTAKPPVVNMGQVKIGQKVGNSFLIVSSAPGVSIASVRSSTPFVSASPGKPEEGGRNVRINLATSGTPDPGGIATEILVAVLIGGVRKDVKVPVVGRFVK